MILDKGNEYFVSAIRNDPVRITKLQIISIIMKNFIKIFAIVAVVGFVSMIAVNQVSAYTSGGGGTGCSGCGDGGGDTGEPGGDGGGVPVITVNPPVCKFLRVNGGSAASLPYGGGNVSLTWKTTNADKVTLSGFGEVSKNNTNGKVVNVTDDTTFKITAKGAGPNDVCKVTVKVDDPETPVPSCDTFSVTPSSLPYGGGTVTLTWTTTNGDTVSINQGIGIVAEDDSTTDSITDTTTYTLTVSNAYDSDTCSDTVTVGSQGTDPAISIIKRDAADKDDNQTVVKGGTATFEIIVTNTGNEDLKNVVVTDPLEPDCDKTIGNLATGASQTYTCNSTNVQNDFTNVANVTGKSVVDDAVVNDTDPTNVDVTTSNGELSCDSFKADDYNVREESRVKLTWETTGATSASINQGVGSVPVDGSVNVIVDNDTTYTLTISDGNDTKTCSVSIETESGGGHGGGSSSPKCDLDISDKKVKAGEKITLTWDTTRANEIEIEDDHGKTIFKSDENKYMDGEVDVIVYKDTEFKLTAEKGSKKRTCKVEVEVEGEKVVEVFEKRDQPLVIALNEVPYTGFDAGPALTALFYTILAFWGLFIAYLLVVRKDSVLGFQLKSVANSDVDAAELELKKKVKMLAAMHSHQPWK